jgi:hypothetical protein
MPTVFSDYEPRASLPRDLGDVRIVDSAALCALSYGCDQEFLAHLRWKAMDGEASENLFP